jgi:hypothetical protein
MWLNADDYFWTEEAVEASMEAVGRLSGEKFPITHGNLVLIDDQDRPAGLRVANGPVHLPLLFRWFRHIHLNIVTMMFPRKLLEAIGPFRTDLSYSIDLDFWIRAAKAGATFHHLDRPITAVRITRSSGKSAHDDRDKQAEWQANVDSHLASNPRPEKINFYRVNPNDMGIQKMAELIAVGCVQVHKAVTELRNMKNMRQITDALVAINSIENQADDIFDMSIERLFATEPDAKEVIKKREIYQVMEIVTDKCEDAANVIESIIVKYA